MQVWIRQSKNYFYVFINEIYEIEFRFCEHGHNKPQYREESINPYLLSGLPLSVTITLYRRQKDCSSRSRDSHLSWERDIPKFCWWYWFAKAASFIDYEDLNKNLENHHVVKKKNKNCELKHFGRLDEVLARIQFIWMASLQRNTNLPCMLCFLILELMNELSVFCQ